MAKLNRVIVIDPSCWSTGVAVWRYRKAEDFFNERPEPPARVGLWTPNTKRSERNWHHAVRWQAQRLRRAIKEWAPVREVACELPILLGGKSRVVGDSGALVKLSVCVGAFAGVCATHRVNFLPVPVADWKGQLPKRLVNDRIRRLLGTDLCKRMNFRCDIWDAVGIGLWLKGAASW